MCQYFWPHTVESFALKSSSQMTEIPTIVKMFRSHWILDRIICLLCVYICHYIFPFYYLDIIFLTHSQCVKKNMSKYRHTRDRLFGLIGYNYM